MFKVYYKSDDSSSLNQQGSSDRVGFQILCGVSAIRQNSGLEKPPEVAIVPTVATEAKIPPVISEPDTQVPISTTNTAETDPALRNYIREKLAELDKFKSTPEFVRFGFGIGGPYNNWLKEVEFAANDPQVKRFSIEDRIAVGDLLGLGMEYVSSKAKETDYTKFTRQAILKVIQ